MTGKPKRRIRIRRKRKSDFSEEALDAAGSIGCCLIEAVFVTTAALALLAVPVGLLFG